MRFLLQRLAHAILVVFLVTTTVFVLMHLAPGDPFSAIFDNPSLDPAIKQQWIESYGLNKPVAEQYVRYLWNVARGDLGWSFSLQRPVASVLLTALPYTILLAATGLVLGFLMGIAVGILQARRAGSLTDKTGNAFTMILAGLPDFWFAILMVLIFAYWLPILPAGGAVNPVLHEYLSPMGRFWDRLQHLILPAGTLAILVMAMVARYQRADLLRVMPEPFIHAARARGLTERRILFRYAWRNALIPIVTLAGLSLPIVFTGAVFIEKIFGWPGAGWIILNAVSARDYPLVTAGVILTSAAVLMGSVLADTLAAWADPRIRQERAQ